VRNRFTYAAIALMALGVAAKVVDLATDGAVARVAAVVGLVFQGSGLVLLLVGIARSAPRR
jgi:hypothetical protein